MSKLYFIKDRSKFLAQKEQAKQIIIIIIKALIIIIIIISWRTNYALVLGRDFTINL